MKQFGINGLTTKISLTTLEKKDSLIDSYLVQNLEVTDLDENYGMELPVLHTREEYQSLRTMYRHKRTSTDGPT